jgi:hypothetical protein
MRQVQPEALALPEMDVHLDEPGKQMRKRPDTGPSSAGMSGDDPIWTPKLSKFRSHPWEEDRTSCRDVQDRRREIDHANRLTNSSAFSATSRQPASIVSACPRPDILTISVTPSLRFCFL